MDDDSDVLIAYGRYEQTDYNIDINREKLDNNPIGFVLICQDSLREQEKYSVAQMSRRIQAKFTHANQNEMCLAICPYIAFVPYIKRYDTILTTQTY